MQLIPSHEVREGMCVAREVRNARGQILLGRGQRLTASLIARLHRFRIEAVYIRDGHDESAPELVRAELKQQCLEVLSGSFGRIAEEAAAKRLVLDPQAIQEATESLVEALLSNKNPLVTLLDVSTSSDRLLQHSVNATVLAITLALDMRIPFEMVLHLASAMMFHDIGMTLLPDGLLEKSGKLSPQELHAMRDHVRLGFEHLVRANAVGKVAASVVLRHHEHLDGSGYPAGVGADRLSPLARIASVVEVYDSLTTVRSYAPAVMPDVALAYILQNTGRLYAREAVLALCRRVALYPTGMAVQLNTGECGIVAGTQPEMPMRPALYVHLDHRGRKLPTPPLVDLRHDRARFVVRSAANLQLLLQGSAPPPASRTVDPTHASIG
ncbi:MAG TPA: HD domain-containing phosphohydrolase [Chthonomonadaceae bacterium]|nr:HD domain-containing phosphohydrolase [Chthonomonadaceae bacterium]